MLFFIFCNRSLGPNEFASWNDTFCIFSFSTNYFILIYILMDIFCKHDIGMKYLLALSKTNL